ATLDCRRAHFSHQEPTDRLRMICHSWKVMFHAEYSSGQPLKMLADLRTVVEETLGRSDASSAGNLKSKAAAAAQQANPSSAGQGSGAPPATALAPSEAPEFDILGASAHEEGDVL
ncbi:MAG TPA: hypothetical protein VHL05_00490, partial [Terriglobales bacterium]|nr:hypothetical protein [Terriglobales bacterium]